eukprot:scaffold421147_cov47-Attheya_sp.AAC.3
MMAYSNEPQASTKNSTPEGGFDCFSQHSITLPSLGELGPLTRPDLVHSSVTELESFHHVQGIDYSTPIVMDPLQPVHWMQHDPNNGSSGYREPQGHVASTQFSTTKSSRGSLMETDDSEAIPLPVFSIGASSTTTTTGNIIHPSPLTVSYSKSGKKSPPSSGRKNEMKNGSSQNNGGTNNNVNRRQKRLERNRESARLSRRRRKHYLEILEGRVTTLSEEMDRGRRDHVAVAVKTVCSMRRDLFAQAERDLHVDFSQQLSLSSISSSSISNLPKNIPKLEQYARRLDTGLSRMSDDLMMAATFQKEQLRSFALPPQSKFILWLTLQNDIYFRGGRAASERLSAARIGEKMLFAGQDRVTPADGMWPLVCNEVGLSYEQEERVRNFQRVLLTNRQSWLERHTAAATENVIHTLLTSIHKVGHVVRETDRSALNVLSLEQRVAFSAWASRRSESIARVAASKKGIAFGKAKLPVDMSMGAMGVALSRENHEAVNLYLLDHKLRTLCETLPPVPSRVPSDLLKGLSQRPLFESLASTTAALEEKQGGNKLSRERSLSSSTSLKRSAADLSQLDEPPPTPVVPNVTPQVAEDVAAPFVQEVLGSVASLIPARAIGNPEMISLNPPVLWNASQSKSSTEDYPPMPVPSAVLSSTSSLDLYQVSENSQSHQSGMSDSTKGHVSFSDDLPERYGGNGPSGEQGKEGYQNSWMTMGQQDSMQRSRSCPTIQSVLPSHMNIVPEDGYLGSISYVNVDTDGAEDFLFDLAEEDWAIGEGLDMDIT